MTSLLVAAGLVIMAFGVAGTIVLPDLFLRLHASTKCGVTGAVTVLMGLLLRAGSPGMAARLLVIMLFIFWTAPLVPHVLGVASLEERQRRQREPR